MDGRKRWLLASVVAGCLTAPTGAEAAGWLYGCLHYHDCPPPCYSPCIILTPQLYRVSRCIHGPYLHQGSDAIPKVPADTITIKYPCPPVLPPAWYSDILILGPPRPLAAAAPQAPQPPAAGSEAKGPTAPAPEPLPPPAPGPAPSARPGR
jgi:hypothetical protein